MPVNPMNRREFVQKSAVTGAVAAVAGTAAVTPAEAADRHHKPPHRPKTWSFSILGTTDLHSHVFDWDYYSDKAYSDSKGNSVGVARVATLIKEQRKAKGEGRVLLVDAGDIIQGTSLGYYFARVDPITSGAKHPMATAMNHMRYDAAALGNHEFNYGIDTLRKFEQQCHFPLLGANALDAKTLRPAFAPYTVKHIRVPGAPDIKVGILGLTNPGIALWDKDNVSGKMVFPAWSSRRRSTCRGCARSAVTSSSSPTTRAWTAVRPTATSCRTSRTPPTSSPSRSPASTRSSWATPTSRCRRTR